MEQFQADLADVSSLSQENDGYRYLLVVIDVFARFLWIRPLRSKQASLNGSILTLRRMFKRYFLKERSYRYIDVLQDMVKTYNFMPHRSLNNISPKEVNQNNQADIWAYMYLQPKKASSL